ncbi:hypothetical protein CAL26_25240 [Bordetella genomosp. 9]|uniref:Uncharacterized protein n=2 Tax=Bordetella genomosp. 9 TaxID=1416803 RepID=A0A261R7Z8_9BORD|nr:hypothetical protein CAL26_25240 [Bordetella genomosp. 9]
MVPLLLLVWEPLCMPFFLVLVPMPVFDCGVAVEFTGGDAVPGGTLGLFGGVAVESFGVVEGVVGADDWA